MKLWSRKEERVDWCKWFAWYPVTTEKGDTVWLVVVERRALENRNVNTYIHQSFCKRIVMRGDICNKYREIEKKFVAKKLVAPNPWPDPPPRKRHKTRENVYRINTTHITSHRYVKGQPSLYK